MLTMREQRQQQLQKKKQLQHVIQAVWRINSEGNKQCGDTQCEELRVWGVNNSGASSEWNWYSEQAVHPGPTLDPIKRN